MVSRMSNRIKVIGLIALSVILALLLFVLGVMLYFKVSAYLDFRSVKDKVMEYVQEQYGTDAVLMESEMGDSYPALPMHTFVFYDKDRNHYFKVFANRDDIIDYYSEGSEERIKLK